MHIESRLFEIAGKVAQKLHTARSRNDQVAGLRMYCAMRLSDLSAGWEVAAGIDRAGKTTIDVSSGLHPSTAAQRFCCPYFMAYVEMFQRDLER